jgi:hypothetical protein
MDMGDLVHSLDSVSAGHAPVSMMKFLGWKILIFFFCLK